jgi:hypothetical protein
VLGTLILKSKMTMNDGNGGKIVEMLMQYDNTLAVMIKAEDDFLLATDPAITQ